MLDEEKSVNKPRLMNAKYFTSIVVGLLCSLALVRGQSDEKSRVMAEISGTFMDYGTLLNGELSPFRALDPGITMAGHIDATRWLDASLFSTFAPEVDYPVNREDFIRTSMVDVRAMARIKSNGSIFRSDALIAPYLATGFGFNIASSNFRPYIPAALGVRLQLSENFALQFEGMYKQPLDQSQIQHLAYSAGFVFGIPKRRNSNNQDTGPGPDSDPDPDLLADSDKDGVPDIDDQCPDVKGKAVNVGCPDVAEPLGPVLDPTEKPSEAELPQADTIKTHPPITTTVVTEMSRSKMTFIREAGQRIYFGEGSAQLNAEAMDILDEVADLLKQYPHYQLQVVGYTDNSGSAEANKVLSVQRGFAVKKYLVYDRGLPYAQVFSDGKGGSGYEANNYVELIPISPEPRSERGH